MRSGCQLVKELQEIKGIPRSGSKIHRWLQRRRADEVGEAGKRGSCRDEQRGQQSGMMKRSMYVMLLLMLLMQMAAMMMVTHMMMMAALNAKKMGAREIQCR